MVGDVGQGDAAVGAGGKAAAALGTHPGNQGVDNRHQQTAEKAGKAGAGGQVLGFAEPQLADDLNHRNAEGQGSQGVHGVVALQEAGEKGGVFIAALRGNLGDLGHGAYQGGNHQGGQEHQENGVDHLANPGKNPIGPQGEIEHQQEKHQGKAQRPQPLTALRQQGLQAYGKGGGGAPGDGEAGADGQIEHDGKEDAVAPAHLTGQIHQAFTAGKSHGGYPQQRKADTGNYKAQYSYYTVGTGGLSHMYGENQIAGTEEQTE